MIRIGHASIGSDGKAKNDVYGPGDNNGKEVCIRSWYNKKWDLVIRAKDIKVAERMAAVCEKGCANNNIGYDQNRRNTLRTQAIACNWDLNKIAVKCSTDCSAFMSICAEASGVAMYGQYTSGNAPTTTTMAKKFYATGMFDILTDKCYTQDYKHLRRGDILVKEGSHTVMVLDNGESQYDRPVLSLGSKGADVLRMQKLLVRKGFKITCDSDFGINTFNALVAFQASASNSKPLVKDGICGKNSWEALER